MDSEATVRVAIDRHLAKGSSLAYFDTDDLPEDVDPDIVRGVLSAALMASENAEEMAIGAVISEWGGNPISMTVTGDDYAVGGLYVSGSDAPSEVWVLSDDAADEMWDQYLDSYIDDAMEIPPALEPYFDRDKWKRDARVDGRGHALSSYDGSEVEMQIQGAWFAMFLV